MTKNNTGPEPPNSAGGRALLDTLLNDFDREKGAYGVELARVTGLRTPTVYPLLVKFQQAGILESAWEDIDPSVEGRPAKRFWRLTKTGADYAAASLEERRRYIPEPGRRVRLAGWSRVVTAFGWSA